VLAFRADVDAGYIASLTELVHQTYFADYLSMAHELQRSGYTDVAAVLAGSTLEQHLRKLGDKHRVATTRQAERRRRHPH
jgi:hypothetical protein